jgi:hypothetical protein
LLTIKNFDFEMVQKKIVLATEVKIVYGGTAYNEAVGKVNTNDFLSKSSFTYYADCAL